MGEQEQRENAYFVWKKLYGVDVSPQITGIIYWATGEYMTQEEQWGNPFDVDVAADQVSAEIAMWTEGS